MLVRAALVLVVIRYTLCEVDFPIDTPIVISKTPSRNLQIMFDDFHVQLRVFDTFPPYENGRNVAKLYKMGDGYLLKFGPMYVCKRSGEDNLGTCRGMKEGDILLWDLISEEGGTVFVLDDECLTQGGPGKKSLAFKLNLSTCSSGAVEQLFDIREIPILPLGWENSATKKAP